MMKFVTVSRRSKAMELTLSPIRDWTNLTKECNHLILNDYDIHDIKFSTIDASPYIQETALIIAIKKKGE